MEIKNKQITTSGGKSGSLMAATVKKRLQNTRILPKQLQQYLWSGQVEKSFMSALSKQQVSDERLRAIASKLTGHVLIGELHPNSFIKTLAEEGNIEQEKARALARDISAQVFAPVRRELMQVYQINRTSKPSAPAPKIKPQATPKTPVASQQKGAAHLSESTKRLAASKRPSAQTSIAPAGTSAENKPVTPTPSQPAQSIAPAPSQTQAQQAPPLIPQVPASKPTVSHDVQSGSIADMAARLKRTKPSGPQAHMVAPGAPPPKPSNKQPVALPKIPSEQNISTTGVSVTPPVIPQAPEEKPRGPVLTKGELLANEEVVAADSGKQKHHGVFGHHTKKPKTPRKNLLQHKTKPATLVAPTTPPSSTQNSPHSAPPPGALSGNTVNLKEGINPNTPPV